MIGQTISHYRILSKLGEGGMGVVYKAYDTTLKRTVALKFLAPHILTDEQQRKRFIHEAQAAAGLTHPNICTVHEVHEADGHTFMVMEYIEGESLKDRIGSGPLEIAEALEIAIQVGRGLSKAHGQGIVHRDIKPGNVLLTGEGDAKIVDFGLAKLAAQTRLTKTGATVGTVMYMSPEQAKGDAVDHRTDIWSLGVMLYEMLTGKLPFKGEVELALVYSIVNQDPEPVTESRKDVPVGLEEVIERSLEKRPEKRYGTVDEFLAALEDHRDRLTLGIKERRFIRLKRRRRTRRLVWGSAVVLALAAAVVMTQRLYRESAALDSIAVLPLENLSGDPGQEYLVDGITGDMISGLQRVSGFKMVKSRFEMMQYKGTKKAPKDIAGDLGVKLLMWGTMQRTGDWVKLGVELIQAETGRQIWSDNFEENLGNVQALIDEITRVVTDKVGVSLTQEEEVRLASARPVDPAVKEAYLRGKALVEKWSDQDFEKSIDYFKQAIDIDSTYAPAYVELVRAYADAHRWGMLSYDEAFPSAKEAVMKATELGGDVCDSYIALGMFRFVFDWDWPGADAAFRRSISLDPNNADAHSSYGNFLVHMGLREASIAEIRRAMELAPTSIWINQSLGWACHHTRRYDDAIAQFERTLDLLEEFPDPLKWKQINRQMLWCYIAKGEYNKAFSKLDELGDFVGPDAFDRVWAYVASGRRDEIADTIEGLLKEPESAHPWTLSILGEADRAMEILESGYKTHGFHVLFMPISIEYDGLRSDPRFQTLLARLDLPWRPPAN